MTISDRASVIIPTFKRENLLRALLVSLSAQKTAYPFEVIVASGWPEDPLGALECEFSDISLQVVIPTEPLSRSATRNAGACRASGDILIFLDDDMTVAETFITGHLEAHAGPTTVVIGNILSPTEFKSHPLARFIERQGARKRKVGMPLTGRCFRAGNGSVSRDMFEKAGMFDEAITTYGEDLDLAMKLQYEGAEFVFAQEAASYHHYIPDIDDMMSKMREMGRGTLPVLVRRHPELAEAMWLHLAESIRLGREPIGVTLKKIGLRVALTPIFYRVASLVYRCRWLGRNLFPVIDYMRLYNYTHAYRDALADLSRSAPEPSEGLT
jgi:GT2 family glycosyltransferase